MSIFDSEAGRAALEKVGLPGQGITNCLPWARKAISALAEVAMMDWLAEKHENLSIYHTEKWHCTGWRTHTVVGWSVNVEAPTRAEALIAAVLAKGE